VKIRGFRSHHRDLAAASDAARMADIASRLNRAAIADEARAGDDGVGIDGDISPIQMGRIQRRAPRPVDLRAFADMDGLIMNQVRTR